MLSPRYFIYLAVGRNGETKCGISSNLRVDAAFLAPQGFHEFIVLQPPQPLWIAEKALKRLLKAPPQDLGKRFRKIASLTVAEIYPQKLLRTVEVSGAELPWPGEAPPPEVETLVAGYSLLGGEIPALLQGNGWNPPWDVEDWLQYLVLAGKIRREAAVTLDALGVPVCRRCGAAGELIRVPCVFCGCDDCYTCTSCQTMGAARSCTPLYFQAASPQNGRHAAFPDLKPHLEFELTAPQQRAARQLEEFLRSGGDRFLVWTVCGGGKTEVSFAAVAQVLAEGGQVLFAIPRKDVVQELLPRFQRAFPGVETAGLYGGSEETHGERFLRVPLTVATTHQCLRFYQRFDLIILDEADAFPYQGSAMLRQAVRRALKPGAKMVIMSATPEKSLLDQALAGRLPYVSIPARHHRQPLIVPEMRREDWARPRPKPGGAHWEPPRIIGQFLAEVRAQGRKALLFLPTRQLIRDYGPALVAWADRRGIPGDYVWAASPNRDEAKNALAAERLCFLVTSTIMERGVTIPGLDVMVLAADDEAIFDCPTLVQIAGRAGRRGEPARVIFVAQRISRSMMECRRWIEGMNQEGKRLGYLD